MIYFIISSWREERERKKDKKNSAKKGQHHEVGRRWNDGRREKEKR